MQSEDCPLSPTLKPKSYHPFTEICKTPRRPSTLIPNSTSKLDTYPYTPYTPYTSNLYSEEKTDRFIPLRGEITSKNLFTLFQCQDFELKSENNGNESDPSNKENNYKRLLESELLSIPDLDVKLKLIEEESNLMNSGKINKNFIFSSPKKKKKQAQTAFTQKKVPHLLKFRSPNSVKKGYVFPESNVRITPFKMDIEDSDKKPSNDREISSKPFKTLDAPYLQDDFYLHLLDWSSQDLLSVILGNSVFLYNHRNSLVSKLLYKATPPYFSSASFDPNSIYFATGMNDGTLEICDINKPSQTLFSQKIHNYRISTIAWNNPSILATGSKDHLVHLLDLRLNSPIIKTFAEHKQEVCGLKWSNDGNFLASGGNDNKVFVFSNRKDMPELRFDEHTAAVKALAWSNTHRGVLLTGGGTNDTTIKSWNTLSNTVIKEVTTHSQVYFEFLP